MIRRLLQGAYRPATCFPIKWPPAVNVRGHYPTQSCSRYHSQANEYTVSMEGFTLREASAAEAIRVERWHAQGLIVNICWGTGSIFDLRFESGAKPSNIATLKIFNGPLFPR